MALKYAECTLAMRFRKITPDGSVSGGPMYYIEMGLGRGWKWMAFLFALCASICSFGSGCMNQSNTLATRLETHFGIPTVWSALIFAALLALVIIGGIRRIGRVTSILAPSMAVLYVGGALVILILHVTEIPSGLAMIVKQAFAPEPIAGGAAGSFLMTLMWGIRRGLFSNEAGQGSAPIAHATAKTDEPVREGLVAALGPFIDTLVICTMTGLVIVLTGAYKDRILQDIPLDDGDLSAVHRTESTLTHDPVEDLVRVERGAAQGAGFRLFDVEIENSTIVDSNGAPWTGTLAVDADDGGLRIRSGGGEPVLRGEAVLTGADLTAYGFSKGLGWIGQIIVTVAVVLFAVSTGISWSYYGDRATEYVLGSWAIPIYRWIFVVFFFLGGILPLSAVWKWGDVALGIMSFPNLVALILLSGAVARMTREYYSREHVPFKK
jgi:AGCS family alanine or glycine:cation symporter